MNIKFYVKETGEDVEYQDDFMLNSDGIVWEEDYKSGLAYATYIQNDLIGWRIVE